LIGTALLALGDCPEHAAERYFEAVFDRPFFLARANHLHKGHELFLLLCQRGCASIWRWVKLERHNIPPNPHGTDQGGLPHVRACLGRLDHSLKPGNPAASTRMRSGPLYLIAGGAACEVPEQLSIWGALSSGPDCLMKLEKQAFDRFCSVLIKALENADDRYKRLLGLGLSPFDWPDITTNVANKALRFKNRVHARIAEREVQDHDIDIWRSVWSEGTVPGFSDADAFWNSEFGRALRQPRRPFFTSSEDIERFPDEEEEEKLLPPEEYEQGIAEAHARGLGDFDAWFLRQINDGCKIAELIHMPKVSIHFGYAPDLKEISRYVADLMERCYALNQQSG
jgi:hypothetical protein